MILQGHKRRHIVIQALKLYDTALAAANEHIDEDNKYLISNDRAYIRSMIASLEREEAALMSSTPTED